MRMPYVMNWSGGLQWEFARNWLLEGQYQGQSGVGLINSWDINAIPLNVSNDTDVLNQIFQATQNYKPYTAVRIHQPLLQLRAQHLSRRHMARGEALLRRAQLQRLLHVEQVAERERGRRHARPASPSTTAGWRKAGRARTSAIASSAS